MKKESFLRVIQSDATVEGSKANVAWKIAVSIDEGDRRWNEVEEYYPVETFAKAFGVELPVYAPHRQRMSQVERFEKKLTAAKEHGASTEDIAYLENKLAQAKTEEI